MSDTKPSHRILAEAVMAHAKKEYGKYSWSIVVETYSIEEIEEKLSQSKVRSEMGAINWFWKEFIQVQHERQKEHDAEANAGEAGSAPTHEYERKPAESKELNEALNTIPGREIGKQYWLDGKYEVLLIEQPGATKGKIRYVGPNLPGNRQVGREAAGIHLERLATTLGGEYRDPFLEAMKSAEAPSVQGGANSPAPMPTQDEYLAAMDRQRAAEAMDLPEIDWTQFDKYPENTCHCKCDVVYRSHTKMVRVNDTFVQVSRKSCTGCGRTKGNCWRVSSDPEAMTIRG